MSFNPAVGIENSLSIQDQQGFRDSPETLGDFLRRHRWALALAGLAIFEGARPRELLGELIRSTVPRLKEHFPLEDQGNRTR